MAAQVTQRPAPGSGRISSTWRRSACTMLSGRELHALRDTRYTTMLPDRPLLTRYSALSRGDTYIASTSCEPSGYLSRSTAGAVVVRNVSPGPVVGSGSVTAYTVTYGRASRLSPVSPRYTHVPARVGHGPSAMSSQSTAPAPGTSRNPRSLPCTSVAYRYGPSPESLWVQRIPGCARLTATPELSTTRRLANRPVCTAVAAWSRRSVESNIARTESACSLPGKG